MATVIRFILFVRIYRIPGSISTNKWPDLVVVCVLLSINGQYKFNLISLPTQKFSIYGIVLLLLLLQTSQILTKYIYRDSGLYSQKTTTYSSWARLQRKPQQ